MLEFGQVSSRFIQRLAKGVLRERLVEPIVSIRPSLVVVSAPSGYGKTVLAAQVASSGVFRHVHWLSRFTDRAGVEQIMAELLGSLAPAAASAANLSGQDLIAACCRELGELPSDEPLLVVLDDVPLGSCGRDLVMVEEALAEAPPRSVAILTTRTQPDMPPSHRGTWLVDSDALRFSDDEIAGTWRLLTDKEAPAEQVSELALCSGRHAALVSLLARNAAFSHLSVMRTGAGSSAAELVQRLVKSQLAADDCRILDYAAVIREGSSELLQDCVGDPDVAGSLARIAHVLPLVSCTAPGPLQHFAVHRLVGDACSSARRVLAEDPVGFRRMTRELAQHGFGARSVEAAVEAGGLDVVGECLCRSGMSLLSGPAERTIRDALALIPAAHVSSDPQLLVLTAEAAWLGGDFGGALRAARLAERLAENLSDQRLFLKARLLVARIRASTGEYECVTAEVEPLLTNWRMLDDVEDAATLLVSAKLAFGLLGDRFGLEQCSGIEKMLRECSTLLETTQTRLGVVDGVVAMLLDGDYATAYQHFKESACHVRIVLNQRASATSNLASSALLCGLLEEGSETAAAGLALRDEGALDASLVAGLESVVECCAALRQGPVARFVKAVGRTATASVHGSDVFGLTSALVFGSVQLTMLRETGPAAETSERGVRTAMSTGSPILVWLAELVHAQASLALGDVERARRTAERILPQVESVGAMGHVLHARLILAQAALSDGDLAAAVQHITAVADHIVEKSPAMVVASYARAFPEMLGPLALAMGVDQVPVRVLNLIQGEYATEALAKAAAVLTPAEVKRLSRRMTAEAKRAAEQQKPEPADAVCHVRLFGGLEVIAPRGRVGDRDWTKRKARLLFAMLVSRYGTDVPRGEIIEYLWPEMEEERALNNFYVVWSAMKRALSPESVRESPCPFVEHTHGVCRVVSGAVISDLDRFAEFQSQARAAREVGDGDRELAALRGMADLYRGELLPGDVYDDWFAPLRERLRREYEDAMLRAAQIFEGRHEEHEGLGMLRGAMENDPWREDLYQATLRLQIASGQRSTAIATYFACRTRLVEDLGIDPSRETTALYEQVLGMEERPHGGENG